MIDHMGDLISADFDVAQRNLFALEARLGMPAQIEYHLDQFPDVFAAPQRIRYLGWKYTDESLEIVDDLCVRISQLEGLLSLSLCD
ncbi:MAG: hypothetical protein O3B95_06055 [Chloroflexi bacterium]|nr:hypothetical protein [Chloroflexota bacterium]